MANTEDKASLLVKGLNETLQSLWEEAAVPDDQPSNTFASLRAFISSLKQYKYHDASTQDVQFTVTALKLTSLCNHEAVLHLILLDERIESDSSQKSSSENPRLMIKVQIIPNASHHVFTLDIQSAKIVKLSAPEKVFKDIRAHLPMNVISDGFAELLSNIPAAPLTKDEVCLEVEAHLSRQWMNAKQKEGHMSACLATFSTVNLQDYPLDLHLFATFAKPEVRNLCNLSCRQEIVLTFKIEKIIFSNAGNFRDSKDTSTDWNISCIVGFTDGTDSEILNLDGARYAKCFSSYPQGCILANNQFEKVANFVVSYYCKILTQYSLNTVQPDDVDKSPPGNFELVVLPPCSINSHLNRLYRARDEDVTPFGLNSHFEADFDCISTSFEAGNGSDADSMVISIGTKRSQMKVEGKFVNFPPMKISFKVGISILEKMERDENYNSVCLALNFDEPTPKYVKSGSNVPTAYLDDFRENIISYLRSLSSKGFNIIYTMPTKIFTTLEYKIIPGRCGQVIATGCANTHCDLDAKADQLVLGILMRTDSTKVPTKIPLIPFSREILPLWNVMNVTMTLLTVSLGRQEGSTRFAVKTWKEEFGDETLLRDNFDFVSGRHIRYRYQESLKRDLYGMDSLECQTVNKITLDSLTSDNQTLIVSFEGTSEIEASIGVGWRKRTLAKWSTAISIYSDEVGLHVKKRADRTIEVRKMSGYEEDGDDLGLFEEHQHALNIGFKQMKKAFDDIARMLRDTVEDVKHPPTGQVYSFVDPRLTNEGGLVFSLCPEPLGEDTV
ncbi:hypothetical protein QCA50_020355 [Cerrena zonata]|uniref:Uncharacterized protein n=1 Tax=Cerrena zonata TaxID=2478898 RepID=A0AAW0F877_9APHY